MKPQSGTISRDDIKESNVSDSTRSSFLSHISHGIRTPLNSIMGFSNLLLDRQLVDGKQIEYARRIVSSSNVLLNFVENLIDLSQFDSNKYKVTQQQVDLNSLLWKIAEDFIIQKIDKDYSEIELSVNIHSGIEDFLITTDYVLLKKSLNRLVELVAAIYKTGKIELGYCIENNHVLKIYVRENSDEYFKQQGNLEFRDDNGEDMFNDFNFEVLVRSIDLIGGRVCTDSIMNEYYIELPIN
ncbi:MAG TPA: hypothetical protein DCQ24_08100 [Bacteroidales bacterium]|nr:hypothetical protein [Bacteroidales bacterium]